MLNMAANAHSQDPRNVDRQMYSPQAISNHCYLAGYSPLREKRESTPAHSRLLPSSAQPSLQARWSKTPAGPHALSAYSAHNIR
jgi:hypothetical protein